MTSQPTTPLLEVAHLRKTYGSTVAVTDPSFTLPPGGALGLVGESGSGNNDRAHARRRMPDGTRRR